MFKWILLIIFLLILFFGVVMVIDNHRIVVRRYEVHSHKLRHRYHIVFVADLHEKCLGKDNGKIVGKIARQKPSFILVGGDLIISKKVWQAEVSAGRSGQKAVPPGTSAEETVVPAWMQHSYSFMRQLCEIAPVYFIDGNHEIRMHEEYLFGSFGYDMESRGEESAADIRYGLSYRIFRDALEQLGVCFLDDSMKSRNNKGADVKECRKGNGPSVNGKSAHNWNGHCVSLADDLDLQGLNLPMYYYRKFQKTQMPKGEVAKLLHREPDPSKFTVLLTHSPVYFEQYARWGADLTLCGHVHGGLMRLPFIGGVVGTRPNLFPKYSGGEYSYAPGVSDGSDKDQAGSQDRSNVLKRNNNRGTDHTSEQERRLIVTCGLGVHTLPIRIFNPGEISVIDLVPDEKR